MQNWNPLKEGQKGGQLKTWRGDVHTNKQTWKGDVYKNEQTYLRMNEHVFVDTKHQSPECSFISIEDWNYLLRHDLLKRYKRFSWQEFLFVAGFCPVTGSYSYGRIFRIFSYDKNYRNFSCDRKIVMTWRLEIFTGTWFS